MQDVQGDRTVSYVVTVYNKAAFLPAVLEALYQERETTGGEIVLVDDGSTDGSSDIVSQFSSYNPNTILILQKNAGVVAATNKGVETACHPYLRLVDADDIVTPGSTKRLMQALDTTGCAFAFGRLGHEGDQVASVQSAATIVDDPLSRMLTSQPFIPATTLGLTAVIKQVLPLPAGFVTAQDFSLGLKLAPLTRFAEIQDICCICPKSSGGLSASKARMFRDTVLLALMLGEEQGWSQRHRRLAIARSAGRARNYLRRHARGAIGRKIGVSVLAVVARAPFLWPYRPLMTYIAGAYIPPFAPAQDRA